MSRSAVLITSTVVFSISYPLLVFAGHAYFSVRDIALGLLGLLCLRLAFSIRRPRELAIASVALVPVAYAALFSDEVGLRLIPVMINLGMLVLFGSTLRTIPVIERFARLVDPELSQAQVAHCRQFTLIWCVFFGANALVAFALSWAPSAIWAIYTGPVNYCLMGLLLFAEFVVRRYRFRTYSDKLYDRVLRRVIPQQVGNVSD
ncbi:hypothetical protein FRD01_14290 [Microvenator marinus]|uniref:Uncharacterized protein n=1 Tax=Microvenator marinus TaxID=2600177 RepID=A0A5B8XRV1_9DELT|nr:hypothetical protein [Microvenator marinus]QED28380.1 hypothetical protein FRD01_14290 [Microvenator marinus]